MAELQTDLNQKKNILGKSIIILENLLQKSLDNPSPNFEESSLIFIKLTRKTPLSLKVSNEKSKIINPLETELLDINQKFGDLRKSTFN